MQLPKSLKIGGHVIRVVLEAPEDDAYGEYVMANDLIRIHPGISHSQQEATLLHEICHVLNAQFDDSDFGHGFLESLSQQLYQVLKDNKLRF